MACSRLREQKGAAAAATAALEPDLPPVDRLLPLLGEGDALRAEREKLRAERRQLESALEAAGGEASHAKDAAAKVEEDSDLERRLRAAVQEVTRENAKLEAEVAKLREENARLRRDYTPRKMRDDQEVTLLPEVQLPPLESVEPGPLRAPAAAAAAPEEPAALLAALLAPPRGPVPARTLLAAPPREEKPLAAAPKTPEAQQREALAVLLQRGLMPVVSPKGKERPQLRTLPTSLLEKTVESEEEMQQKALRGALHALFRGFAR